MSNSTCHIDHVDGYKSEMWEIPIKAGFQLQVYSEKETFKRKLKGFNAVKLNVFAEPFNANDSIAATVLAKHGYIEFGISTMTNMGVQVDFYLSTDVDIVTPQQHSSGNRLTTLGFGKRDYYDTDFSDPFGYEPFGEDKVKIVDLTVLEPDSGTEFALEADYTHDDFLDAAKVILQQNLTEDQFERAWNEG